VTRSNATSGEESKAQQLIHYLDERIREIQSTSYQNSPCGSPKPPSTTKDFGRGLSAEPKPVERSRSAPASPKKDLRRTAIPEPKEKTPGPSSVIDLTESQATQPSQSEDVEVDFPQDRDLQDFQDPAKSSDTPENVPKFSFKYVYNFENLFSVFSYFTFRCCDFKKLLLFSAHVILQAG
jgi:hypothetical protein